MIPNVECVLDVYFMFHYLVRMHGYLGMQCYLSCGHFSCIGSMADRAPFRVVGMLQRYRSLFRYSENDSQLGFWRNLLFHVNVIIAVAVTILPRV